MMFHVKRESSVDSWSVNGHIKAHEDWKTHRKF